MASGCPESAIEVLGLLNFSSVILAGLAGLFSKVLQLVLKT